MRDHVGSVCCCTTSAWHTAGIWKTCDGGWRTGGQTRARARKIISPGFPGGPSVQCLDMEICSTLLRGACHYKEPDITREEIKAFALLKGATHASACCCEQDKVREDCGEYWRGSRGSHGTLLQEHSSARPLVSSQEGHIISPGIRGERERGWFPPWSPPHPR